VPRLESYGPSSFRVSDPAGVCRMGLGYSVELDTSTSLELESPVSRAMPTSFALTD